MDDSYIEIYIYSLKNEYKKSENTVAAYRRDIKELHEYLRGRGLSDISELTNADVVAFLMNLKDGGRSGATIKRKMASLRSYADFLRREGVITEDPCENIKAPRVEERAVEYLTVEEVEGLLAIPDDSIKGMRDRAILELMYSTGIRVTELTELKLSEVNLRIGYITCSGPRTKARIIPMGKPCRAALESYLENARPNIPVIRPGAASAAADEAGKKENAAAAAAPQDGDENSAAENDNVFVNFHGEKLTRQGLWKIVRGYADKAGIGARLTPQLLRNSFAVHMIQNGADMKSIQELMGYEDAAAVQIYLSATKNRIKEVYDRTHPRAGL